ncbi:MAG: hypothetical protein MI717_13200 [Spirochaetales bacterium]|nr:hypothetical protein [Spirochaetales bacterium]
MKRIVINGNRQSKGFSFPRFEIAKIFYVTIISFAISLSGLHSHIEEREKGIRINPDTHAPATKEHQYRILLTVPQQGHGFAPGGIYEWTKWYD